MMQELNSQLGTWELQRHCVHVTNDYVAQMGVRVGILFDLDGMKRN